jgi:23S rRNA-/tRNA-specific pseudouridylate synthase
VNDKFVAAEIVLKRGDKISHAIHRHEPPVSSAPIKIVHESEDLYVFNKPASIPMHPAGRFRHNTVLFIVVRELKLARLHSVHRLDRY